MNSTLKTIILYVLIIGVVIFLAAYLISGIKTAEAITYDEIIDMIYQDKVKEFTISSGNVLKITTTEDKTYSRTLRSLDLFLEDIDEYLQKRLETPAEKRVLKSYDIADPQKTSWFLSFLPYLIIFVAAIALWM